MAWEMWREEGGLLREGGNSHLVDRFISHAMFLVVWMGLCLFACPPAPVGGERMGKGAEVGGVLALSSGARSQDCKRVVALEAWGREERKKEEKSAVFFFFFFLHDSTPGGRLREKQNHDKTREFHVLNAGT